MKTRKASLTKDESDLQRFLAGCVRGESTVDLAYLEKIEGWHHLTSGLRASFAREAFARIQKDPRVVAHIIEALRVRVANDQKEEGLRSVAGVIVVFGEASTELLSELVRVAFTSGSLHLMDLSLRATRAAVGKGKATLDDDALELLGAALIARFDNALGEMIFTADPRVVAWVASVFETLPAALDLDSSVRERALARAKEHQLGHSPATVKRTILETIGILEDVEMSGLGLLRAGVVGMMQSRDQCCDSVGAPVDCSELALRLAVAHHLLDAAPLVREEVGLTTFVLEKLGRLRRLARLSR